MKVKCIDKKHYIYIKLGEIYEVIEELDKCYKINNNSYKYNKYQKECFEIMNEDVSMKGFSKDALKSGMVVETKGRGRWLVVNDALINTSGYMTVLHYEDDLTLRSNDNFTITKVFDIQLPHLAQPRKVNEAENMIWERKEVKEMTIAQIEKELGYAIKIIK